MRFKLTIVLLLANLVVFFALWRLDRPAPISLKPSGLVDFQPDHIVITDHLNNETRELVHEPGKSWRLVQPVEWPAVEDAVVHLTNFLVSPEELSHFSADDLAQTANPLSEYGLDKPRVEITVSGPNGKKSVTLLVGNSTPAGNNLYVMNPADHQVRVWTQDFFNILEAPVKELRDNSIFTFRFFELQSLSIWSPKLVKFSTDPNNHDLWQLDTPLQRPADSKQVNQVVSQLLKLKADSFLSPAEAKPILTALSSSPALKVELKSDTRSQTLSLGAMVPNNTGEPQYYAKRDDSDAVFTVAPGNLLATLLEAQKNLREHQFVNFDRDKVTTITLKVSDLELRMQKSEQGAKPWRILLRDTPSSEPTNMVADKGVILSFLDDLRRVTAKSFTTDAPGDLKNYGLADPNWKVTLQLDDKSTLALDIGRVEAVDKTPARYYAKLENAESVYEIDSDIIGELSQGIDPLYYRDRVLESLPATAQITSLKLVRLKNDGAEDGAPIFDFPADPAKSLDEQLKDKPPLLQKNIIPLKNWLKSAEVDGYLKSSFDEHKPYQVFTGDSALPEPAPWRYRLDAGVQIPGVGQTPAQNQTLTFYFTEQIGAHQYGGTHNPEAIFDLPISILYLLGTFTRDASLPAQAKETLQQQDQPIDARAPSGTSAASPPAVNAPANATGAAPAPANASSAPAPAPAAPNSTSPAP